MTTSKLLEQIDLNQIQDLPQARQVIFQLLNLIEDLQTTIHQLQEENQQLRDEINRQKGEQGRPPIKPNRTRLAAPKTDLSSETERHQPKTWHKSAKRDQVKVDREVTVKVDPAILPPDAEFKGYEDTVVQDLEIHTDNVLFHKEKYYSPSQQRSYLAELPKGYSGQYGPGVRALALVQYFACNMSEPKILDFLTQAGLLVSKGELSNWLIQEQAMLHAEKDAIYTAGLGSSPWQHIDDTATRVDGINQHCHIVCNPLYTAFFTTESKSRLAVLDVLRNLGPRTFRLNAEALAWLDHCHLSSRVLAALVDWPREQDWSAAQVNAYLEQHLPGLGAQTKTHLLEATAVAAYHAQLEFPVIRLVVCDDAPQFEWLTEELALCWVHDGRHYKKLLPWGPTYQAALDDFLKRYWAFYAELVQYRTQPSATEKARLSAEFDTLFATVTHYQALDERIAKTRQKKASLLMVLEHPEIPLHNNPAELGARLRVRKRDVSFGPRTEKGKQAWDTVMTVVATAKKLGVNITRYLYDRVSGAYAMPALAELIAERARQQPLGASWNSP